MNAAKKVVRGVVLTGGFLVALGLILFVFWRIRLANDVARQMERIRAAGLPTNEEQLNSYYPAVSSPENAALVVTQAFARMANYPDERSNTIAKFRYPTHHQSLLPAQKELLAGYVQLNRETIQLATQGVLLPKSRYPVDFSPGFATVLPHLAALKNLAQAVAYKGTLAIDDDQPAEAIQSIDTIVKLSNTLDTEPLLISALVRFRIEKMAKLTLERALNFRSWDEENLAQLKQALAGWNPTNRLTRPMIGERALAIPLFNLNFAQFCCLAETTNWDTRSAQDPPAWLPLTGLMRSSGFFQRDLRAYLAAMKTNIDLSTTPPPDNLEITNVWKNALDEVVRRHLILCALLLPALDRAYIKNAESIADNHLAKTALAIEEFRLRQHRLPNSLNELPGQATTEAAMDPFNGQLLKYNHLEKGYEIYSVAADGEDNGGRERPADAKSTDHTHYDITFTVER